MSDLSYLGLAAVAGVAASLVGILVANLWSYRKGGAADARDE